MAKYDRDVKYIHPVFNKNLPAIIEAIKNKLPAGWNAKLISGHRTPSDQFEIYKKGREFVNGTWRKTGTTFTNIDGFAKLSRHNYLPALSIDIGLFRPDGKYETASHYAKVAAGAKLLKLDWGGDWRTFKDQPHIEVPPTMLFRRSPVLDTALQWQKYLYHAGAYTGALDGQFGANSIKALKKVTGSEIRDLQTWEFLYREFGPVHKLPGLDVFPFIPDIP